jgi:small subunit ribosomal protein S17
VETPEETPEETEAPTDDAGAVAEADAADAPVAEADAAEPADEAAEVVAEVETDVEAEDAVAEIETESAPEEAPAPTPRKKKKRLPRALRPARSKPKREKPAERKPISRLPKPEGVRGRTQERQGTVVSSATDKTIVVRVDTVKAHPRYKKVIRRSTKLHAHDEQNEAKVGDVVLIVETRPLSRMKRWRLQRIVEAAK